MKNSLNEIIRSEIKSGNSFNFSWRIFLDRFYEASLTTKLEMVSEEVNCNLDQKDCAFIAAAVHKLCRENGLESPSWIFNSRYFLNEPYFSNDPPDALRLIYLVESPPEFKMRNIFTSENTLSRA